MMKKRPPKINWIDEHGYTLYAGGIIITDTVDGKDGMWTIIEEDRLGQICTDIGGRYDYNDGDIFATIARELREELYNCVEVPYKVIKELPLSTRVYTYGHQEQPVYLCIIVSAKDIGLENLLPTINIKNARDEIIAHNPNIPTHWYRTLDLRFVAFEELSRKSCPISKRLEEIINESYINNIINK